MSDSTSDARGALRELFQLHFGSFHFGPSGWLSILLVALAGCSLVLLLGAILYGRTDVGYVSSSFRHGLAWEALFSWVVSTLCAYARGFIAGRLYAPRA